MGITARPPTGTTSYERDFGNVVIQKRLVSRAAHLRCQSQPSAGERGQGWRVLLVPWLESADGTVKSLGS